MISQQAKDSIERIFLHSARTRLPVDSGDACDLAPVDAQHANQALAAHVVVLTISSISFRLLLVLHFDDDQTTRDYYLRESEDRLLAEALMEVGNLCCGAINQKMVEFFPDLGMSTPYPLSGACVPYLTELKPDYLAAFRVSIGANVQLGATLCVCASSPVDFVAHIDEAEESTGELELF
ncbi:hypothetical protein [Paraburkholderia azotifigens]|uniref:Chemotaxis protein CheX n=1 Tax=Paraburkholderia azotifigens TaxID=2057004 RepID=A0A5C6VF65_9BURK|nr:hypothetical protein [Paraburkholderia azotifigens]TXC83953.1 hypothetical protein FRZ40_26835 [Paraburkholderia azotifigens]